MAPPKVSNLRLELLKPQNGSKEKLTGIMTVTSLSESLRRSYPSSRSPERSKGHSSSNSLGDSSSSHIFSKSVSFGTVSFRSYERTVGDHPAVSGGPALDLSWKYHVTEPRSITEYEILRKGRRTGSQMIIKRAERELILRSDLGVSRSEVAFNVRNITKIKNQRRQTLNNLRFSEVEESIQRIKRFVARCFCLRKKTEHQIRDLWRKASDLSNSSSKGSHSTNHSVSPPNPIQGELSESSQSSSKKSNIKPIKARKAKKNRSNSSNKSMADLNHAHHNQADDITNSPSNAIDISMTNHRNLKYDLTDYDVDDSPPIDEHVSQETTVAKNSVQDTSENVPTYNTESTDPKDITNIEESLSKRKPSITISEDDERTIF